MGLNYRKVFSREVHRARQTDVTQCAFSHQAAKLEGWTFDPVTPHVHTCVFLSSSSATAARLTAAASPARLSSTSLSSALTSSRKALTSSCSRRCSAGWTMRLRLTCMGGQGGRRSPTVTQSKYWTGSDLLQSLYQYP
jgi:hypothetical protein